jgi:hypothetical protein
MRDKFDDFWRTFAGKTPGIFLCRKSLRDFAPQRDDDWLFLSINDEILNDEKKAIKFFGSVRPVYGD